MMWIAGNTLSIGGVVALAVSACWTAADADELAGASAVAFSWAPAFTPANINARCNLGPTLRLATPSTPRALFDVAPAGDDAIGAELLLHDPSAMPTNLRLEGAESAVPLAAIC